MVYIWGVCVCVCVCVCVYIYDIYICGVCVYIYIEYIYMMYLIMNKPWQLIYQYFVKEKKREKTAICFRSVLAGRGVEQLPYTVFLVSVELSRYVLKKLFYKYSED